MLRFDDAALATGTIITVRDLFFNVPARQKFLRSEQTELAHIASLVTHYSLAHPDKHFELHSATHALLIAPASPPRASASSRSSADTPRPAPHRRRTRLHPRRPPRAPALEARRRLRRTRPVYLRLRGFISMPESRSSIATPSTSSSTAA